jgi:hypothetical protein
MKLHRPYIPIATRVRVAERQLREHGRRVESRENLLKVVTLQRSSSGVVRRTPMTMGRILKFYLQILGSTLTDREWSSLELHHRPALCNRYRDMETGEYLPPANDPEHLIYLPRGEHDIETRVHGVGAQRSDLGQRRYLKKVAKNRSKDKKRPSRWPKGRKLRSKPINARWRRRRKRTRRFVSSSTTSNQAR